MAIFKNRPLAAACALFLLVVFAAYFLPSAITLAVSIFAAVLAAVFLLLFLRRTHPYRFLLLFLLMLAIAGGALRVFINVSLSNSVVEEHIGTRVSADISLLEISQSNSYGAQVLVEVDVLNGDVCDFIALLRCEHAFPFFVGDRVRGEFVMQSLDFEPYDQRSVYYYKSEGAVAQLISAEEQAFVLLESGTQSARARWWDLRAILSHRMTRVETGEGAKLLAAMLLGSKQELSDATVRDFRLCGVSHLLALSGLHLVILIGLLDRLLYMLYASRRVRIAIVLPCSLFYLMLTGCNYSLLRAVLMLCFVYLAFLLRGEKDALTALCFSATLILLVTPYAVFSTSFQMTVLATLGILSFGRIQALLCRLLPRKRGFAGVLLFLLRAAISSLVISLSTTLCMLPVLWLTIGSFSLLTPLANLLLVPLAPILLVGALLLLLLPIPLVASVTCFIAQLVLSLASFLATPGAMLSFHYDFVPYVLIPVIALTLLLLMLDLKKLYPLVLLPSALGILAFAVALTVSHAVGEERLQVAYRSAGKSEGLILVQNSAAVICDLSTTSFTQLREDWREAQALGATRLEVLMLTHYHAKSALALSAICDVAYPAQVWLPTPETEKEKELLAEVLAVAIEKELVCTVYERERALTVFQSGTLTLSKGIYSSRSTEPAFTLSVRFGNRELCYHTAALSEYLRNSKGVHACTAQELILGAHGPVVHEEIEILGGESLSRVLLGSEEVLEKLTVRDGIKYLPYPGRHIYVLE